MTNTNHTFRATSIIVLGIVSLGIALSASSRPEKIRPGHSYYCDALAEPTHEGLVRALGPEKNYEEVYQFYTFYEFVYDEAGRVIVFREYERGEVIRTEEYRYDESGSLTMRVVSQPGTEKEVTVVEPEDTESPPK